MRLEKTATGRSAIESRQGQLNRQERRVVILADGKRTDEEIVELLGAEARATINALLRNGYLVAADSASASASAQAPTPATALRAPVADAAPQASRQRAIEGGARTPAPEPPAKSAMTESGAMISSAVVKGRRSLAAAKMYLIDMLQLMRNREGATLSLSIHTSASEDELLACMVSAVRFMDEQSGRRYALNVLSQLQAIIPEPHLAVFEGVFADEDEQKPTARAMVTDDPATRYAA